MTYTTPAAAARARRAVNVRNHVSTATIDHLQSVADYETLDLDDVRDVLPRGVAS